MASSSSRSTSPFMVLAISMLLIAAAPHVNAKLTCEQVTVWLTPCISYGVFGGPVPPACCDGLRSIDKVMKTREDRITKCNCVKEGAAKIPGLDYDRCNKLPGICGTSTPYKLTRDIDCSKVK
ncbi:Non-specific lipid-transfer protein [Melia azedarach]|uniref:Non-specific lipid-transfer protein n=1 Tax=Melia azedarach TaxID=155640 RepID=A0ACC1XRW9_MELAZ|nr:Non-specific lipid-transfer protein [Melia azedarach]